MTGILAIVIHATILATLLASSHAVLKWVSSNPHDSYLQLLLVHWKATGLALSIYGLVFFYYILVLRSSPISILYPIYTGLSVVLVLVFGRYFFNEMLGMVQLIGILLIIAGIVLLGSVDSPRP